MRFLGLGALSLILSAGLRLFRPTDAILDMSEDNWTKSVIFTTYEVSNGSVADREKSFQDFGDLLLRNSEHQSSVARVIVPHNVSAVTVADLVLALFPTDC